MSATVPGRSRVGLESESESPWHVRMALGWAGWAGLGWVGSRRLVTVAAAAPQPAYRGKSMESWTDGSDTV